MLHKLLFKLGQAKRNPSLQSHYNFLLESDIWSKEQIEAYQLTKLKELLVHAYNYSPFYTRLFNQLSFDPNNIQSIDDLNKLPLMDKRIAIDNNKEIQSRYDFKKLFVAETSGTSGATLKIFRSEEWDSYNRAALFRGYHWYGVNPWDKNGYFWGFNISPKKRFITRVLDKLQNRFRIFSYSENEVRKFVEQLKKGATFIGGYSSMIYETAKMVNKLGIGDDINLKMIKGTSEKIYDSYQEEVKKAFGKKIISEYGSCETGIIAYECPECGNMHIVSEHVIVECIDGEIVVTNLLSHSFPIIRYKLGDSVELEDPKFECSCGRKHPVIKSVLGRVGKKIIGKTASYPSLTFYYVFKNMGLTKNINLNYQAQQTEAGKVVLLIEQDTPEYLPDLNEEIIKYFGNDIDFTVMWGQKIRPEKGKLRDFITTIN